MTKTADAPEVRRGRGDAQVDRTRAAALEAVIRILRDEGWDAVTQHRVAELAGIGRATVYRHWPDRTALIREACADYAIHVHITPTGDLRRDLIAELDHIREELVGQKSERIMAALVDRAQWDPEIQRLNASLIQEAGALIRELLAAAQATGEVSPAVDFDLAVTQLIGPMVFRRLVSNESVTRRFIEEIVDDFLALHTAPAANRRATRSLIPRRR